MMVLYKKIKLIKKKKFLEHPLIREETEKNESIIYLTDLENLIFDDGCGLPGGELNGIIIGANISMDGIVKYDIGILLSNAFEKSVTSVKNSFDSGL